MAISLEPLSLRSLKPSVVLPVQPDPGWMRWVLILAGVYNVLWGAWCVLFPGHFWSLLGMEAPNYPFLWQCIGMIVGVYGVGYWIASRSPVTHWPIVLVGMLGKIFGPLGFVQAHFIDGAVPLRFGSTLLTNDLIWWVPFTLILVHAYRTHESRRLAGLYVSSPDSSAIALPAAGAAAVTSSGLSIGELSERGPLLIVFLRHLGCTFCREALTDLARDKEVLRGQGVTLCLVHMSNDRDAAAFFSRYGLADAVRVSDPSRRIYEAFGLRRGSMAMLVGWRSWVRGAWAGLVKGHGVGRLAGDGLQMPGAFLLSQGRVVRSFVHEMAGDRPDYCSLAGCPVGQAKPA